MSKFFSLEITNIIRETPQAISIEFEVPEELQKEFHFYPGQYLTLRTSIDGEEIRRSYSICSAPGEPIRVTVKEVERGKFSVFANNKLRPGMRLEVHPPEGRFVLVPEEIKENSSYVAFAAGSGITPVLSMIKSFLSRQNHGRFVLVYGNRNPEETIFHKELLQLQLKYPERLFVEFVYSRCNEENCHFGRIDDSTVNFVIKNKYREVAFSKYFLCGPEEMIEKIKNLLELQGVAEAEVLFELFSTEVSGEVRNDLEGDTELTIMVDDEETQLLVPKSKTVLQAALDHGLDVPYSCQGGICSSCVARVTEGTAEMEKNSILVESEIAEGLVLTCQAHPTSPVLKVDYDDV